MTSVPAKMIEKYKVRQASKPRIYTLTLNEDGFYKTLKRRVADKLKTIDNKPKHTSDVSFLIIIPQEILKYSRLYIYRQFIRVYF